MKSIDEDMPEDEDDLTKVTGDDADAPIIKLINQLIARPCACGPAIFT